MRVRKDQEIKEGASSRKGCYGHYGPGYNIWERKERSIEQGRISQGRKVWERYVRGCIILVPKGHPHRHIHTRF
jgi:hypothetical protein